MCFDVPKVVRSPGCDHGHDEDSRNGRDVKIDILDDYIRTSIRFRVIRVFIGVPESYGIRRGEVLGLIGPYGNREERPKERRRATLLWFELDKGCSPLFLLPLPLLPSLLLQQGKEESYSRWE